MKSAGRILTLTGLFSLLTAAFAFQQPANPRLPNFDNRAVAPAQDLAAVADDRAAAIAELRTQLPNLTLDFHPVTRSPKMISNRDGFLTGPGGSGAAISKASLAAIPSTDTNRITKAFIQEHSKLFGFGPEALDQARLKREYVTAHNGMRTAVWEQQVDNVPVFEAVLISHTTAKGELVNIASAFAPNPQQAADRGVANRAALLAKPPISAQEAVAAAAANVGEPADAVAVASLGSAVGTEKAEKFKAPFLIGEAEAKLIWLPMDEQTLRLCWTVTFTSRQRGEMFTVLVDAQTRGVQVRHCLTDYISDVTYRVFTSDSPSPFSPGWPTPSSSQPALISRSLVTLPALNTNASPLGWIIDGGNETVGNNVDAHTDTNNDNLPDLPRPQGSPPRVFDFAMDLTTQNPGAYSQAAVVQLFYWNNFMHDKLYELGFTEAAGNFQSNNFGRGGLGNDAVQADAQDGGGFNNANFSTPADGSPGRMQMYIFNGPTPQRDGDLDAEVVLHEYTHGLSNRRVGGGVGISALQPSGMGEGWSDFYGLSLLSEAGDDVNGVYAAGAYVTYQLSGMTQNYYFGIRRYPYCTDMNKNPLTFKDIDPGQASAHTGIPRSGIIGTTADEVHNMGEVWCVTLWDVRANMINKYGWALGNQRMLQLVTDGMGLAPANPTFLQARDAIIQADLVDFGGANRGQLWTGFAKRGMGVSATSPASSTTVGLVEAYDLPDDLQIVPAVLTSSGPVGGPFTPNPAAFKVINTGSNTLNWALSPASSAWFSISPTNGTLTAGGSNTISLSVNSVATNFPLGTTNAIIWFTNQTSGIAQSRTFALSVVGRSLFENFEPNIHVALWSALGGTLGSTIIATNYGGSVSPVNSLWFGDAGTRSATTIPVDTSAGGSISFYLRLANGGAAPWETVDIPTEGVVLEYSTNGGATFTIMGTYDTATFYSWTQVTTNIPGGAVSPATYFRWRQLSHSGTCCDHWALDDISIDAGPTPPSILTQPQSQTVKSGNNVGFTVSAQGSFPLIYQWRKNGTNLFDGGRISGASSSALNISTVVEADSGQYSVLVTNVYGSLPSSNATLLVTPLDHFEWSAIATPQAVGVPFNATITAKDFLNATVTNYGGSVNLSGSGGGPGEIYRANFESGLQGFTISNTFGLGNGLWHLSTGRGGQPGHSPSNSVYFGTGEGPNGGGTYNTGTAVEGVMVSPSIDLRPVVGPLTLKFSCVIDSEPGTSWDHATFEVSTNDGASYDILASNNQGGNVFGTSSSNVWITVTNDFSVYAGQQVRLRLHFNTIDSGANAYEGWYVDDIVITGSSTPITVSPASTGSFTNGIWSGPVTVQAAASNAVLRADDGSGHAGLSNPFQVVLQDDLSVAITDSPDPVAVGANLTYMLNVVNVGPSPSRSVTVTNFLPSNVNFVSATSSQGTCTQFAGIVKCKLGTIGGGTNATVTIIAVPTAAGVLTNTATVTRAEADPYLSNNVATVTTVAQVPAISITDCALLEGNSGTTNASFTVSLSVAGALPISVNYATADGTALAPVDYVGTNGTITFTPGQTNKTIFVAVKGDTAGEPDETFFVNLTGATNATLADAQGVGTILNDDLPSAAYVRSTAGAPWGSTANETAMNRVFGTNNWQDLRYETLNPNVLFSPVTTFIYMEGSDVDATEMETFLTANIPAVQTWVSNGGSLFLNAAPNEDNGMDFGFGVTLIYSDPTATATSAVPSHPIFNGPFTPVGTTWNGSSFGHASVTGAVLTALITNVANAHTVLGERSYGRGHVLFGGMTTDNFHTPQPQASNLRANILAYLNALSAYHFEWSVISSPKQFNVPFPVTITARDVTNGVVTTFNSSVYLSAWSGGSNAVPAAPATSGTFTNGVWSGTVTVQQPAVNVTLTADDGGGHSGSSNPFDVIAPNDLALRLGDSPDPVSVGASLTYTLTITNSGPSAATAVTATNLLPPGVTFVSAIASQGTCTQSAGTVSCSLGSIAGATNATVTIVVVPTIAGTTISNFATISRGEADGYAGNNSAAVSTVVTTPAISIADASVAEGDAGTTNMLFAVTLAAASAQTITVNYQTSDGTASAGSDFFATNGFLSFSPGTTNLFVTIPVIGDKLIEPNETFTVTLFLPVNGVLGRSQATGTIVNDDGLPGYLDHFAWNAVPSPQAAGVPFGATITAKDYFSGTVTNFSGTVGFSALGSGGLATNTILGSPPYTNTGSGSYTLGYSFTPNTNLMVTHVRHFSGTKVSIWTDVGALLATQNVASTPGVWMETALATPLQLTNGVTYRVAMYTAGSNYFWRDDLGSTFPNGFINQSYEISGDAFPTGADSARWWFVDLRYTVGSGLPIPVTPVISGNFTNGVWSGNVAVQQLATNVTLIADDGAGHAGISSPFDLVLQNDLSVAMSDAPDPVSVGANLTYTLTITNTGPLDSSNVMLTNYLPANATFRSAAVSQGTYTQSANLVICSLGSVPGATNASVSIVVVPTVAGVVLTNTATVSRTEAEPYLGNNTATALTTVTPPQISIADSGVIEGNVGSTNMTFAVSLDVPSTQPITVNFTTANGSAVSGSDYLATNGVVAFAPGITNQTVTVRVLGDVVIEGNETFFVTLFNPINGVLARTQATGTITNDDGLPGRIDHFAWQTISSPQLTNLPFLATITALDASSAIVTNFTGPVTLGSGVQSGGGTQTVQVLSYTLYADTSGSGEYRQTLTAISNYFPNFVETTTTTTDAATLQALLAGKQVFLIVEQESAPSGVLGPLGTAWATVLNNFVNAGGIVIACSYLNEENLILSNSGLMNLARTGNLTTDTLLLSTSNFLSQGVSTPFTASYTAWYTSANGTTVLASTNGASVVLSRDVGAGHVVMIGTDFFTLGTPMDRVVANAVRWAQGGGTSTGGVPITPTVSGTFTNGVWSGGIAVQVFATNVVLRADDGDGHIGLSNPFHVISSNQPPVVLASPANTTAYLGGTASFAANVLASAPISYQWRFNGANIAGATNSTLNLTRVTLASAGNYSLLVSNPYGTNTTAKAVLSILQVVAWGAGTNNSGVNSNFNQAVVPSGLTNASQLAGGLLHSLAARGDGKVSAWGAGTTNTGINPQYGQSAVPPLGSAQATAAGGYHSLALRTDGTVAAWGAGTASNLLSLPHYGQSIVPVIATNIVAIAAGDYHSVALRNDGRVLVWGYNGFSQTNVPVAATSNVVAIASKGNHVLALKSDGSLVHWGNNTTLPVGVTNIVTIAAGVNHCLALRTDGTVVSFGSQPTVPFGLSNIVDIAAGNEHSLALRSDGTVVTWGATNLFGRNQIPPGISNFVGIACGYYHSMGFLGDGSPLIKWQPVNRAVLLGTSASFYVMAVGTQLRYQWQLNGANILNATNFTYNIPFVQLANGGSYRALITGAFGSVTSAVASLTILSPIGSAVEAPGLTWTTSGNAAWFGETTITHDGIDAAQSGLITDNQQSSVQASVSGPGTLNFWWKVSSEQFFDFLTFYIDGVQQAGISGEVNWQFQTFPVGSGTHTLKWTYQKDSSVSAGLDAGWLDQVQFITNPPVINLQPIGQTNSMGALVTLNVSASGAPPISYQWIKAGTNIPSAVSSFLNIVNATRRDSAVYSVVASNPGGSTPSSNAVVLIRVPQLLKPGQQSDGTFVLLSGDADGGALSASDVANFECQISSNLVNWVTSTNSIVLTNGNLMIIDEDSTNAPFRLYRIIEH